MLSSIPPTGPAGFVSPAQQQVLRTLRARYAQHHDLFSQAELARLRFVRWLYRTGRLAD
jgi:hypothetical protein